MVIKKRYCFINFFIYALLVVSPVAGEWRDLDYTPYFAIHYSTSFSGETGLPVNDLNTVIQDQNGFLYFGSWGSGIFKFDGHSWIQYSKKKHGLNDDKIISMVYDGQDFIFLAHQDNGITRFNIQTCHGESLLAGRSFPEKISKLMYVPGGLLYICTVGGGGLYRYELATGDLDLISLVNMQKGRLEWKWNALRGLFCDSRGRIWIGSRLGVVLLDKSGKAPESYYPYRDRRDQQVYQLFETNTGRILVLAEQFIGIVNPEEEIVDEFTEIPAFTRKISQYRLSDDRALLKDRLGNYLLLTKGGGVCFDPSSRKVYQLAEANNLLIHDLINSGFIDDENNIWITTQDGVTQLNVSPFKNVSTIAGICLSNFNTTDPEYHLMSANLGGVWLYNKAEDLLFELRGGQYRKIELALVSDLDHKLSHVFYSGDQVHYQIGSEYYTYDSAGDSFRKEDLFQLIPGKEREVRNVVVEKNGIRYSFFSRGKSDQGMTVYNPIRNRAESFQLQGGGAQLDFLKVKLYFFNRNKEDILIVNEADPEHCFLFNLKSGIFTPFSFLPQLQRLTGKNVRIKFIKGTENFQFWIVCQNPEGAVFFYSGNELRDMTAALGTENITIEDCKVDNRDRLLLATATRGLFLYSEGVMKVFGTGEGLAANRLTGGIAIDSENGDIYINSIDSVSLFDETLVTDRNLSVQFTQIRNADPRLDLNALILAGRSPSDLLELPPVFRTLDICAAANTYASKRNIAYTFVLEEGNPGKRWTVNQGQENHVVLYDLHPGHRYNLKVSVRDHLNRVGEEVLSFRIKFFWYETGLFIGFMVFLFVMLCSGLGVLISVKRTRQLERKAMELEELVNMRTASLNITKELLRDKVQELEKLAQTDTLTDLSNRRHIMQLLEKEYTHCQVTQSPFCIILGDIDHFKTINDRYGHGCGDKVLQAISLILRNSIRKRDFASRWGGEEFLILLPDCTREVGHEIAEEIRAKVEEMTITYHDASVTVTMSFGVAEFLFNADGTCDAIIKRADDNLYSAKDLGRNRVIC